MRNLLLHTERLEQPIKSGGCFAMYKNEVYLT